MNEAAVPQQAAVPIGKEESHENKLTYRHFVEIISNNGAAEVVEPSSDKVPDNHYPQMLGIPKANFKNIKTGQTNNGCNSAIRSSFRSLQRGSSSYKKYKGVVLYLPLGKVLRNTRVKSMKTAIAYVEKYIKLLQETGVIFDVKCLGEIKNPVEVSISREIIRERLDIIKPIRAKRVFNSVMCALSYNGGSRELTNTDITLEKRWIGVSVDFNSKILSPSHALAHVTAIRYLFYNRYNGITNAFMKILKAMPEINKLEALSLAHYWNQPIGGEYSAYYGLMPVLKLLSFASNTEEILTRFKNGKVINEAFSKCSKSNQTTRLNVFGDTYKTAEASIQGNRAERHWKGTLLPLVKKNDFKAAYDCINKWVNGES